MSEASPVAASAGALRHRARLELVDDATVVPIKRFVVPGVGTAGTFDGGVYQADGAPCELALHRKEGYVHRPHDTVAAEPRPARVDGLHIYGGLLQNGHFGHFMTESLSRLWASDISIGGEAPQSIVFIPRTLDDLRIRPFTPEMLSLLGCSLPLTVVESPMRFERLVVPEQLFGLGALIRGHPTFHRFASRLRTARGPGAARRLYVSRSRLKPHFGHLVPEEILEGNLKRSGYEVIYPEQLTLAEQYGRYNSATHLIFSEGSAIHTFALVASPHQSVAIVYRRAPRRLFREQIASFGGSRVVDVLGIRGIYEPDFKQGAANRALTVIDLGAVGEQLVAEGFVDRIDDWDIPTEDQIGQALRERMAKVAHARYVEVKV